MPSVSTNLETELECIKDKTSQNLERNIHHMLHLMFQGVHSFCIATPLFVQSYLAYDRVVKEDLRIFEQRCTVIG